MKYTSSKKLIYNLIAKEEQRTGLKINALPLSNRENIYNIIEKVLETKKQNKNMTILKVVKTIIKEIIDEKDDLGICDSESYEIKIRLTNIAKISETTTQYLWLLLRTTYHELNHGLVYQEVIKKDPITKFKIALDHILAEIGDYYKIHHDEFYMEILANNYSIEKTIHLLQKYPELYHDLQLQAESTKLLFKIYSQNYDAHQMMNHISLILRNEEPKIKEKQFATIEYLPNLFTEDGNIKLEATQPKEIKYIIASSKVYLSNLDFNKQSKEELEFILESLTYTYNIEQIKAKQNIELRKRLDEFNVKASNTDMHSICDSYLIPLLNKKQTRNKTKIKYLKLQIEKTTLLLAEKTSSKKLTRIPNA